GGGRGPLKAHGFSGSGPGSSGPGTSGSGTSGPGSTVLSVGSGPVVSVGIGVVFSLVGCGPEGIGPSGIAGVVPGGGTVPAPPVLPAVAPAPVAPVPPGDTCVVLPVGVTVGETVLEPVIIPPTLLLPSVAGVLPVSGLP